MHLRNLGAKGICATRACHTRKGVEPHGDLRYAAGCVLAMKWFRSQLRPLLSRVIPAKSVNCSSFGVQLAFLLSTIRISDICIRGDYVRRLWSHGFNACSGARRRYLPAFKQK